MQAHQAGVCFRYTDLLARCFSSRCCLRAFSFRSRSNRSNALFDESWSFQLRKSPMYLRPLPNCIYAVDRGSGPNSRSGVEGEDCPQASPLVHRKYTRSAGSPR
jgi:hypothetical protein